MHPELPFVPPAQRCDSAPSRIGVNQSPGRRHAPGTAGRRAASRGARLVASLMPLFVALALLLVASAANAASVRLSPAHGTGNQVPTFVIAPSTTPGTQGATRFNLG